MYPTELPSDANTCEGEPGFIVGFLDRFGAECATSSTQPAAAAAPIATAHTTSSTPTPITRPSGKPRLLRRRRCRSRRLIIRWGVRVGGVVRGQAVARNQAPQPRVEPQSSVTVASFRLATPGSCSAHVLVQRRSVG